MTLVSWLNSVIAGCAGAVFVKLLDIVYLEYKRNKEKFSCSKELLDKHVDPILKSADELLGELIALTKEDFESMYKNEDDLQIAYVIYLFANFWSRLAILRRESMNEHLSIQRKGQDFLQFIATFEAKRNRIVNRALQRGIGESILEDQGGTLQPKTFCNFFEEYVKPESSIRRWVQPIRDILIGTSRKSVRHKIIFYAVILHAFVDTCDSEHKYIRDRHSYPNKLTPAMRRDLRYRVFGKYLPMVKNNKKYWQ